MKSRITIEVDFENNNQPCIQIISRKSDDVRDNLIQSFLQKFHESGLCAIEWRQHYEGGDDNFKRVIISPISSFRWPDLDNREQTEMFLRTGQLRGSSSSGIGEQMPEQSQYTK